mmetsp:Transcript_70074/g.113776  ORF Transcript_70074/g.113776 Transcript_70074/m.113776 type:complete len:88 (+) Transcript_70074:246-509(+)
MQQMTCTHQTFCDSTASLHHTATHTHDMPSGWRCDALQRIALQCNTLQRGAKHATPRGWPRLIATPFICKYTPYICMSFSAQEPHNW